MKRRPYFKKFCKPLLVPLLLAAAAPASAKSIGKDQVNIRSGPSLNSDIIFVAPLGYPIEIEKQVNNWALFHDWQNNNGWVYKPLISNVKTAVILVDKANLRSSAGRKARVVATAALGEIYKVLSKKGNWSKLGYFHGGSALGWIRNDLVFGE